MRPDGVVRLAGIALPELGVTKDLPALVGPGLELAKQWFIAMKVREVRGNSLGVLCE
jgi:hypothetical protein